DLINLDQQNRSRAFLQGITGLGGAPAPTGPAAAPGPMVPTGTAGPLGATPPALPGRTGEPPFQVSGIKLDARGNPMIDLSRPGIKQWIVSADGRSKLGVDDQGRVLASMPASPSDRAPEDVPMSPAELLRFRDARGQPPPPGITPRQISAGGYTPI